MSYDNMQPTPSFAHANPCLCAGRNTADKQPCYLWIHLPYGPGRVITFDSITAAYTYGEKYVFTDQARHATDDDGDGGGDGPTWTSSDGMKWIAPYMDWDMTLCKILNDISDGIKPHKDHWLFVSTERHQMLIGLGFNLPLDSQLSRWGYSLEAHDKPDDMPALLYQNFNNIPEAKAEVHSDAEDTMPALISLASLSVTNAQSGAFSPGL